MIFDELAGSYPAVQEATGPVTQPLPVIPAAAELVPFGPGADAELVQATDNGLRPDDAALPQPPQDPLWTPEVPL